MTVKYVLCAFSLSYEWFIGYCYKVSNHPVKMYVTVCVNVNAKWIVNWLKKTTMKCIQVNSLRESNISESFECNFTKQPLTHNIYRPIVLFTVCIKSANVLIIAFVTICMCHLHETISQTDKLLLLPSLSSSPSITLSSGHHNHK